MWAAAGILVSLVYSLYVLPLISARRHHTPGPEHPPPHLRAHSRTPHRAYLRVLHARPTGLTNVLLWTHHHPREVPPVRVRGDGLPHGRAGRCGGQYLRGSRRPPLVVGRLAH